MEKDPVGTPRTAPGPLILVVDDFEDNREMYTQFLRFNGYRVAEAVDGLDALAKAGALLPDLIKPILEQHRAGRRADAAAAYARVLPLINYENRQCGLRATKTVMAAGGVIASDAVRHPLEALSSPTRAGLLELVTALAPLAARWGK